MATIKGLTIAINGETTGLTKALSGVNSQTKDLQKELRSVESLLRMDPGNTELLAQKQKLLTDSVAGTKEKLDTLKEAARQAQEQLARGEISEEQFRALEREVAKTEQALKRLEDQSKEFGSVFAQQMKQAGQDVQELGSKITDVGGDLTKKITVPIVAGAALAHKAWGELDDAIDGIAISTGAVGEELAGFEDAFRSVYGSIPSDAATVGTAIGEVNTQLGLHGKGLEDAATKAIKFAEINGQDVSKATRDAKSALEAYGLGTEDFGHALDAVTAAAQDTGVSTDKLFDAIIRGAPQLKEMELDMAQAAQVMGRFEQKGIDGTRALSYMARGQVQFAKEGKTLSEGLDALTNRLDNAKSETEKLTITAEYFGTKGASVMLEAFERGALDLEDFASAADNAAGATSRTFEETLDPVDRMTEAMNNLKLVGYDLSSAAQEVLAPQFEKLVGKLQSLATWFKNLDPRMKETIVKVAMIAAAIGPLLVIMGTVIGSVGKIMTGLSALGPVVKGVSAGVGLFSKALAFLAANPIVLVVAAIVGLVAVLMHLWKTNEEFRDAIIAIYEKIKEVIGGMVSAVKTYFTETIPNAITEMLDILLALPTKMKEIGSDLLEGLWNGINDKVEWLKGKVKGVVDRIKSWFSGSDGFDTHSPSKWGERLGGNISAGIAKGIASSITSVASAVSDTVDTSGARQGLQPGMAGAADQVINITLNMDGRQLAQLVVDPLEQELARRGSKWS